MAIAQADADKAANDAKVESETQIAQKQNQLEIRKAELKITADTKRAEAEAAYEIQNQAQQKVIGTATVDAEIAKTAREAELKKQEVEVAKQALDAKFGPRRTPTATGRSRRPRPPCSSGRRTRRPSATSRSRRRRP